MQKLTYQNLTAPASLPSPERIGAEPAPSIKPPAESDRESFVTFLEQLNLAGMGGAGFPVADKIRACVTIHTLVINGVECEPGVSIDQALLQHHAQWIKAGAEACARAVGAKQILLAVKKNTAASLDYPYQLVRFPDTYPAGAEKLIINKITGKKIPPGTLPYEHGYLVQNVSTLRAIGRALLDGVAVCERPLTVTAPGTDFYKNIIAPIGMSVRELLETINCPFDPARQIIVATGLMMGHAVEPEATIEQTTTSLIIISKTETTERDCIRCGACNDACPLNLHPIALVERIQKGKTKSAAFRAQLTECFLCGACSTVCPANIPLVQSLQEGKQCLR